MSRFRNQISRSVGLLVLRPVIRYSFRYPQAWLQMQDLKWYPNEISRGIDNIIKLHPVESEFLTIHSGRFGFAFLASGVSRTTQGPYSRAYWILIYILTLIVELRRVERSELNDKAFVLTRYLLIGLLDLLKWHGREGHGGWTSRWITVSCLLSVLCYLSVRIRLLIFAVREAWRSI